jgi:flagellum-specific peptidoglycan hydrolase FlgJ
MTKWILCFAILVACTSESKDVPPSSRDLSYMDSCPKPTRKLVLKELRKLGVKHPRIVLAQSMLETGHYSSSLTRTHNNLFGFRTKNGYLHFKNWKESCAYYKRWQDRHYKPNQHRSYYGFLRHIGYAEDPNYTSKVKTITDELSKQ